MARSRPATLALLLSLLASTALSLQPRPMQRRQETGTGQPYTPSVPGSQPSEPPYPVPSNTSTLYPTGTGTGTGGTAVPTPTGTLLYPGNAPVGVVVGDGIKCTTASFDMKWRVENFMYTSSDVYTTPANRILNGEVSFTLVNTALEAAYPESYVPARCDARSTRPEDLFYGDQTFGCTTEGDSRGLYSGLATFTWNKPAKTLTMTQMWKCEDYGYPITYRAEGSSILPFEYEPVEYINSNWTTPGDIYKSTIISVGPLAMQVVQPEGISASAGLP